MLIDHAIRVSSVRPRITVIVPFRGTLPEGLVALDRLDALRLEPGDELIVADNTERGILAARPQGRVRIIHAPKEQSAYHPRNVAASQAKNDWLLFTDADCRPLPALLDLFFEAPPALTTGVVAGAVVGAPDQPGVIPRYARSRRQLSERFHVMSAYAPAGVTGNLLVRRAAHDAVGGFVEGVRDGSDIDYCWRIQRLGWGFEHRPGAIVEHAHVEALVTMIRQASRHAGGSAWLERRWPGSQEPRRDARRLVRCAVGVGVWLIAGRFERALFKGLDAVTFAAGAIGSRSGNAARQSDRSPDADALVPVRGPWPSAAGSALSARTTDVDADLRPIVLPADLAGLRVRYAEDRAPFTVYADALRLARRRPLRWLRSLGRQGSSRWSAAAVAVADGRSRPGVTLDTGDASGARELARLTGRPLMILSTAEDA